MSYAGQHDVREHAAFVLAAWFERVDPHEVMNWQELAQAMLAPECDGPLANPEFVAALCNGFDHELVRKVLADVGTYQEDSGR